MILEQPFALALRPRRRLWLGNVFDIARIGEGDLLARRLELTVNSPFAQTRVTVARMVTSSPSPILITPFASNFAINRELASVWST